MLKLDQEFLTQRGLSALSPEQSAALLQHLYETLELRVGLRIADQMSDQQLGEFEALMAADDQEGALGWLELNFPDYRSVVRVEFDRLGAEIAANAQALLAAA